MDKASEISYKALREANRKYNLDAELEVKTNTFYSEFKEGTVIIRYQSRNERLYGYSMDKDNQVKERKQLPICRQSLYLRVQPLYETVLEESEEYSHPF